MNLTTPTPNVRISESFLSEKEVEIYVKREDLLHPVVSGNKWRKLKYNLEEARKLRIGTLLTFGGAYSNHISAVAFAAMEEGFKSIGVIRGERMDPLNATLAQAEKNGMRLFFVSREKYRMKDEPDFQSELREHLGEYYMIPEGGSNRLGVQGCIEMGEEIFGFTHACVPVGTGTTLAGLAKGIETGKALGFPVLKGEGYLEERINELLNGEHLSWQLIHDYHFDGYAKYRLELIAFINRFSHEHGIQLDPIYTGKMMYGIYDLVLKNFFPLGSKILAIHTGGLQGIAGFNQRFGNLIKPLG